MVVEVGDDAIFFSLESRNESEKAIQPAYRKDFVIFWDGVVVFWNCSKEEREGVFKLLKSFEIGSYPSALVDLEAEYLDYIITE